VLNFLRLPGALLLKKRDLRIVSQMFINAVGRKAFNGF
jgi:hypothetical protein